MRDVSVEVSAHEVLGVLGPSGAGKSTFFGALVGEQEMASGERRARRARRHEDGRCGSGRRLGLGYIPQSPSVLWDLTVRENFRSFFQIARGKRPGRDGGRGGRHAAWA